MFVIWRNASVKDGICCVNACQSTEAKPPGWFEVEIPVAIRETRTAAISCWRRALISDVFN